VIWQAAHAAVRKARSNGALWATSTLSLAKARNARSAAAGCGARPTMSSVMPVSVVMLAGMAPRGRTRDENSPVT